LIYTFQSKKEISLLALWILREKWTFTPGEPDFTRSNTHGLKVKYTLLQGSHALSIGLLSGRLVFSAVPFEKVLDLHMEVKKEQQKALTENRKQLLSTWQLIAKKYATSKS
jgi:hypothetical protein